MNYRVVIFKAGKLRKVYFKQYATAWNYFQRLRAGRQASELQERSGQNYLIIERQF